MMTGFVFSSALITRSREGITMKTLVIYAHLLAACVSIGTLLLQDLALWRSRYRVLTQDEVVTLRNTATIVFIALLVLWATGAGLVTMGYLENPQA
jgi:hypothetical protein